MPSTRFAIRFDPAYRLLSSAVLIPPSDSYLELEGGEVYVRMAWAFRARFPRSAVARAATLNRSPWSRGVHGWGGRWLVNGSGDRILVIQLEPAQRAHVMGFPVRLRELMVSVDDPGALASALQSETGQTKPR
jgi:hypothetical protein